MLSLFADIVVRSSYGIGEILVFVIVIAACLAVLFVALRQFGVQIPPWVFTIFWIVAAAFIAILAIRFLLSM